MKFKLATIQDSYGKVPQLVQQNLEHDVIIAPEDIEGVAIWKEGIRVDLTTGESFYVPLERANPFKELEVTVKENSS